MRILFWGTSAFAVPCLRALVGEGFDVAGVVTRPDKPVGRSRSTLAKSPVKEVAEEEGCVPILQPEQPRGDEFLATIRALEPELSVVVSYGHILRPEVIDLPRFGTVNVHASLLPKLRGAAPIQAAIREGLLETGVTILRMVPALDAGPVILQARTPIAPDETYGELHLRLSELGALALVEALTLLELGTADETPQEETQATYARKIGRGDARLDWREGCGVVARAVRAYDPTPGAFTTLRGQEVKLFGASEQDGAGAPGTVLAVGGAQGDGMLVACGECAVRVVEVQPAGKRRMTAAEWSRGRGVKAGDVFGD